VIVVPEPASVGETPTETKLAEMWKQKEKQGKYIKCSGILLMIAGVLGLI